MNQTTITDVLTIGVPVKDQDAALTFFTDTLGFEKLMDARVSDDYRWITVAAPGASTSVALVGSPTSGADTGIRFQVPDADAEHAALQGRGVDVGELLRWPGVPPMFEFKDPDGNRYTIVEAAG